jgi:hypothetical protein
MTSYVPVVKNGAGGAIFYVSLVSQANTKVMQASPTLAVGDFKVSIDGGALANVSLLPTNTPGASAMVKITLSQAEVNGDNIAVFCSDAAGSEWCDLTVNIQTVSQQINDLATPTNITAGTITTVTNVTTVNGLAANVVTAAALAADAVTEIQSGLATSAALTTVQADTDDIQTRLPAALIGGRIDANVGAISSDATAADNAESFFDGTGYAGTNNVIPIVSAVTGLTASNLDATVSSRASQTSVDDLPTNAELATALGTADDAVLAAIAALNDLSEAEVRTALGMGAADMDSQLGAIAAALVLVKLKTDQLQFSNVNKVDASILAVADLAAAVANKIADHMARRTSENIEASSDGDAVQFRSLYGAIAKLTNKVTIVGGTLTVKKADDSANLGFQTTTGTAGADPITAVDTT